VWIFDSVIRNHSVNDIKYGSNIIKAIELLGDIGFVFYCSIEEDPMMNFWEGSHIMPRVFTERWKENHTPCQVDRLEYSPILLKTIVKTFLPNNEALVAFGISKAIPSIVFWIKSHSA
jgi:hypothetical protein